MYEIYYVKNGRAIVSSVRYDTESRARLEARHRGYYDGKLWKVREVKNG